MIVAVARRIPEAAATSVVARASAMKAKFSKSKLGSGWPTRELAY